MSDYLLLALMSLTVWRVVRFISEDGFPPIRWLRDKLAGIVNEDGDYVQKPVRWSPAWFGYLLTCYWCLPAYPAAALIVAVDQLTPSGLMLPGLWWGAVTATSSLISVVVDRIDAR